MATPGLIIRPFQTGDQDATRRLILEGLGGHFGFIDEAMNPDLDDIASSYGDALFLIADIGGEIAGTGALVYADDGGRIVRMSTAQAWRRNGVATALLKSLVEYARSRGLERIALQTQPEWSDAVGFYEAAGFRPVGRTAADVVLSMDL